MDSTFPECTLCAVCQVSAQSPVAFFECWRCFCWSSCFALDYKAIEYLRHGTDILYFDTNERMLPRPPLSAVDCAVLAVLVALQAIVIFALYQSHRRNPKVHPPDSIANR
jgi:hypothetical protein